MRDPLDRYYTPTTIATKCAKALTIEYFEETMPCPITLLEPNVGTGNMLLALEEELWPFDTVSYAYDIDPACPYKDATITDFLSVKPFPVDYIIGNPPYAYAQDHIEHCFSFMHENSYMGMLLRLSFLASKKRASFWEKHHPTRVCILSSRPSFTGNGTDSQEYAFFIWQKPGDRYSMPYTLRWI